MLKSLRNAIAVCGMIAAFISSADAKDYGLGRMALDEEIAKWNKKYKELKNQMTNEN